MKTLIFNGSPKIGGDTTALIDEFVKNLHGDVKIISCYDNIAPCNDCRYCWNNRGCSIDDEMQNVYRYIEECDNIVIASPIWFSSLSGTLLNLASRVQTYYQNKLITPNAKNGVIIIVGAQKGTEVNPIANALTILKFMNVSRPVAATILSLDTDNVPAAEDTVALNQVHDAAMKLNKSTRF